MDGTSIIQGKFTGTGNPIYLSIRQDVDWMRVINYTIAHNDAPAATAGSYYYWQRGMPAGEGVAVASTITTGVAVNYGLDDPSGFTLIDTSDYIVGSNIASGNAITNISNAVPPRVTIGSTALLQTGDVVLLNNAVGAKQLSTIPFTITVVSGTTFDLAYMRSILTAAAPTTSASLRVIPYNPQFFPRTRVITKMIVNSANSDETIITLSVVHQYSKGQKVRLVIPRVSALAYGFQQDIDLECTIVNTGAADANSVTNTITVDVPFADFGGTFTFPLTADIPFTPAQVVPVGENTAEARALSVDEFAAAFNNRSILGMKLGGGINTPGGALNDVMYWRAGKSYLNDSTSELVITAANM